MANYYRDTDPYGTLEFAIGSEDDFTCFDYEISEDLRTFRLHAVINSETGHFIQNASDPIEVSAIEAPAAAQVLVDQAIDWLAPGIEAGDEVIHDVAGWNQDPQYFVRCVTEAALSILDKRAAKDVPRIAPDPVHRVELTQQHLNTIIAALRLYQGEGYGDPSQRPGWLHDIATNLDNDTSLDSDGIDSLIEEVLNNVE